MFTPYSQKLLILAIISLLDIRVSYCVQNIEPCSSCDRNSCQPPRNCLAGLVKDSCECCYVCARTEGERCDHEDLHLEGFGHCGDNLECRVRNDLDWDDPPEAVCVCSKQKPLCGSDGVTYENICQLTETRYRRRDGLRAVSAEPCVKPPKILSPPLNVRNSTGSYAAMTCEANAWPAPDIQWHLEKNGNLILLPEIISIADDGYEVKYLKKDPNCQKFTREDSTLYEVDKKDIIFKLPDPILTGGSERQLEELTFGIDLSDYNLS